MINPQDPSPSERRVQLELEDMYSKYARGKSVGDIRKRHPLVQQAWKEISQQPRTQEIRQQAVTIKAGKGSAYEELYSNADLARDIPSGQFRRNGIYQDPTGTSVPTSSKFQGPLQPGTEFTSAGGIRDIDIVSGIQPLPDQGFFARTFAGPGGLDFKGRVEEKGVFISTPEEASRLRRGGIPTFDIQSTTAIGAIEEGVVAGSITTGGPILQRVGGPTFGFNLLGPGNEITGVNIFQAKDDAGKIGDLTARARADPASFRGQPGVTEEDNYFTFGSEFFENQIDFGASRKRAIQRQSDINLTFKGKTLSVLGATQQGIFQGGGALLSFPIQGLRLLGGDPKAFTPIFPEGSTLGDISRGPIFSLTGATSIPILDKSLISPGSPLTSPFFDTKKLDNFVTPQSTLFGGGLVVGGQGLLKAGKTGYKSGGFAGAVLEATDPLLPLRVTTGIRVQKPGGFNIEPFRGKGRSANEFEQVTFGIDKKTPELRFISVEEGVRIPSSSRDTLGFDIITKGTVVTDVPATQILPGGKVNFGKIVSTGELGVTSRTTGVGLLPTGDKGVFVEIPDSKAGTFEGRFRNIFNRNIFPGGRSGGGFGDFTDITIAPGGGISRPGGGIVTDVISGTKPTQLADTNIFGFQRPFSSGKIVDLGRLQEGFGLGEGGGVTTGRTGRGGFGGGGTGGGRSTTGGQTSELAFDLTPPRVTSTTTIPKVQRGVADIADLPASAETINQALIKSSGFQPSGTEGFVLPPSFKPPATQQTFQPGQVGVQGGQDFFQPGLGGDLFKPGPIGPGQAGIVGPGTIFKPREDFFQPTVTPPFEGFKDLQNEFGREILAPPITKFNQSQRLFEPQAIIPKITTRLGGKQQQEFVQAGFPGFGFDFAKIPTGRGFGLPFLFPGVRIYEGFKYPTFGKRKFKRTPSFRQLYSGEIGKVGKLEFTGLVERAPTTKLPKFKITI